MHQIGKLPLLEMQYKAVQKYEHVYFLAGVVLMTRDELKSRLLSATTFYDEKKRKNGSFNTNETYV